MKTLPIVLCLGVFSAGIAPASLYGQAAGQTQERPKVKMTKYYLVLLRPGPAPASQDKAVNQAIFEGHMANIRRLGDAGKMIVAGPIAEADSLEGVFVLNAASLDEAKQLVGSDPAIQARRLKAEVYAWYAPQGLRVISDQPPPRAP